MLCSCSVKPQARKGSKSNNQTLTQVTAQIVPERSFMLRCSEVFFKNDLRMKSPKSDTPWPGLQVQQPRFPRLRQPPENLAVSTLKHVESSCMRASSLCVCVCKNYNILYCTVLYYTTHFYAALCSTTTYAGVLYYTTLYYAEIYCILPVSTILYYTTICYTRLYVTIR